MKSLVFIYSTTFPNISKIIIINVCEIWSRMHGSNARKHPTSPNDQVEIRGSFRADIPFSLSRRLYINYTGGDIGVGATTPRVSSTTNEGGSLRSGMKILHPSLHRIIPHRSTPIPFSASRHGCGEKEGERSTYRVEKHGTADRYVNNLIFAREKKGRRREEAERRNREEERRSWD